MNDFTLDSRLENDCINLCELESSVLLLMNNALVPWFIVVPKTDATELFELSEQQQLALYHQINQLSNYVLQKFGSEKINVAAIGNVVKQLHIHIVGRSQSDFCWPGVVWGRPEREPYSNADIATIRRSAREYLGHET